MLVIAGCRVFLKRRGAQFEQLRVIKYRRADLNQGEGSILSGGAYTERLGVGALEGC